VSGSDSFGQLTADSYKELLGNLVRRMQQPDGGMIAGSPPKS